MKLDVPAIGILRGVEGDFFGEVMQVSFAAGLEAIEITMNTDHAEEIVKEYIPAVPSGKWLGMGTIRNIDEARRAIAAGAMFLVTPNLDIEVIEYANEERVPIITGALTPSEIYTAWHAGADMIKVFPCGALGGAKYIKSLRGPFDTIPLVAVGGVSIHNLEDFFSAGVAGVGVSTSIFGGKALREKDLLHIGENVKNFIDRCRAVQDGV